ncbi:MAG: tail fiber domain-containing protein [Geovibrio sp.]|nr:tail fiber domain-containing protein [Geovibrio sp.]
MYGTRIMIDNQTAQTMSNKSFGTAMMPASNNAIDIGSASVRTRDIFTVNAVNVLSNAQHKQDVRSMTAQELACAQELAQNISLFRWKDAVAGKGENARIHIGMIAQEVVTIFLKHGLCANDYGLLCFDSWVAETVEHEAEYEQIEIPAVTEVRLISEAVLDKDGNEQEPAVYEIVELEPARIEQGEIIAEAWTETVKDAGEAYSLRTEELLYFIMAGQEARMKNIEERLTLLE